MRLAAPEKRLEWAPRALDAYLSTLARIAEEDPFTARRFMERVERSLSIILSQPDIGTPATRRGERESEPTTYTWVSASAGKHLW